MAGSMSRIIFPFLLLSHALALPSNGLPAKHNHQHLHKARDYVTVVETVVETVEAPSTTSAIPLEIVPRQASTNITTSYAAGSFVIKPTPISSSILGPSTNDPSYRFISDVETAALPSIASNLLVAAVDNSLTDDYSIWNGTGALTLTGANANRLEFLSTRPSLSRDSGLGGYLNGYKLFIFCDTATYTQPTALADGTFTGFVSNSVAIDEGNMAQLGSPLTIRDKLGEWLDEQGGMRGFVPLTEGEAAYNNAMEGGGNRFAIWPCSSITPLTATTAIQYAPIIFQTNINGAYNFAYQGATLLEITVPGLGGPVAQRLNNRIFTVEDSVTQWGVIGGIRSWGASGVGGSDGYVYIIGGGDNGLSIGRTEVADIADGSSYEFWYPSSGTWSNEILQADTTETFLAGSFHNMDIFYSPRHLTWLIVYMDAYVDNKFWWRYLDVPTAILPGYAGGAEADYVSYILKYSWSPQTLLFQAPTPADGSYIYAGGVHKGYFDEKDITNGGSMMLLTWTSPTGKSSASVATSYSHMSATVQWS